MWKKEKITHHAHVFISRNSGAAIIVTLHYNGKGGFLFENEKPVVLQPPLEPESLGKETLAALQRTELRRPTSFANRKLRDWPAFNSSKVASVRQFQQEYIQISVSGANYANLVYVVEGEPALNAELHIVSSISSCVPSTILGERILLVFAACRDRQV